MESRNFLSCHLFVSIGKLQTVYTSKILLLLSFFVVFQSLMCYCLIKSVGHIAYCKRAIRPAIVFENCSRNPWKVLEFYFKYIVGTLNMLSRTDAVLPLCQKRRISYSLSSTWMGAFLFISLLSWPGVHVIQLVFMTFCWSLFHFQESPSLVVNFLVPLLCSLKLPVDGDMCWTGHRSCRLSLFCCT